MRRFQSCGKQRVNQVAQTNFTFETETKAFGFLLVYNFISFATYLCTLENTRFMSNKTRDVFAATLHKTKFICYGSLKYGLDDVRWQIEKCTW